MNVLHTAINFFYLSLSRANSISRITKRMMIHRISRRKAAAQKLKNQSGLCLLMMSSWQVRPTDCLSNILTSHSKFWRERRCMRKEDNQQVFPITSLPSFRVSSIFMTGSCVPSFLALTLIYWNIKYKIKLFYHSETRKMST